MFLNDLSKNTCAHSCTQSALEIQNSPLEQVEILEKQTSVFVRAMLANDPRYRISPQLQSAHLRTYRYECLKKAANFEEIRNNAMRIPNWEKRQYILEGIVPQEKFDEEVKIIGTAVNHPDEEILAAMERLQKKQDEFNSKIAPVELEGKNHGILTILERAIDQKTIRLLEEDVQANLKPKLRNNLTDLLYKVRADISEQLERWQDANNTEQLMRANEASNLLIINLKNYFEKISSILNEVHKNAMERVVQIMREHPEVRASCITEQIKAKSAKKLIPLQYADISLQQVQIALIAKGQPKLLQHPASLEETKALFIVWKSELNREEIHLQFPHIALKQIQAAFTITSKLKLMAEKIHAQRPNVSIEQARKTLLARNYPELFIHLQSPHISLEEAHRALALYNKAYYKWEIEPAISNFDPIELAQKPDACAKALTDLTSAIQEYSRLTCRTYN